MSPIVVILLTYQRTEYALRTITAAQRNLRYPGGLLWYVADDGSRPEHYEAVVQAIDPLQLLGAHSERLGYGAGANKAMWAAAQASPLALWLEDDWELIGELDLAPFAGMLVERADIGMVRMGYLNLNMRGTVFGSHGRLFWLLDRTADSYVFTGHPSLRHARFHAAYGEYPVGLNPGETELGMALKYRNVAGPEIVWPAGFGEWGQFGHIGQDKSY